MTTTVRPRSPAELALTVPYQLGYHPGPSLVLSALNGRRLGMLQRHDLITDPEDCARAAGRAVGIMEREGAGALLVIAFEDDEGESAPLREAVLAAADEAALPVQEHTVVRDGRWFAPDCRQPCCPEEGLPLPRPEDVPSVATFVGAGVAPLPSRDALAEGVLPERDEARADRLEGHLEILGTFALGRGRIVEWDERLGETWRALLDPDPEATAVGDLGDAVLARAGWSLGDVHWRDALMAVLCPGTFPERADGGVSIELAASAAAACPWVLTDATGSSPDEVLAEDPDTVLRVRERLVELSRVLPLDMTPPVLTLVAHVAWWSGDGTVAAIALERALDIDPDYRLAGLMDQLLSVGVRLRSLSEEPATTGEVPPGEAA